MAVIVNTSENLLEIMDTGVTLRTLLAAAGTGYSSNGRRQWGIRYKNMVIGNVQISVKTHELLAKRSKLKE